MSKKQEELNLIDSLEVIFGDITLNILKDTENKLIISFQVEEITYFISEYELAKLAEIYKKREDFKRLLT